MGRDTGNAAAVEEVDCALCHGTAHEILCSAAELRAHQVYLAHFHRRRLADPATLEDRAEFTQDYTTDIVACTTCGLIFRNPRPRAVAVSRTYAEDTYSGEFLANAFTQQLPSATRKAARLAGWLGGRRKIHVVEVGSFVGSFLHAGRRRGWTVLGIDPGAEVIRFCRERGLPVFRGTLPEAAIEPQSVDAVAIWNTFDQLPHPEPALKAAVRALRPGGVLAIRIPNGGCFRWGEPRMRAWGKPWAGWLRAVMAWNNLLGFPYLYGYTVETLDRLVCRLPLQRVAVEVDTLVPLADTHTKRWAALEEWIIKTGWRWVSRVDQRRHGVPTLAPWIDVYYRSAGSDAVFSS